MPCFQAVNGASCTGYETSYLSGVKAQLKKPHVGFPSYRSIKMRIQIVIWRRPDGSGSMCEISSNDIVRCSTVSLAGPIMTSPPATSSRMPSYVWR